MAIYDFQPSSSTQEANWGDPASWIGGAVPNDPDAEIYFPTVIELATGEPYGSFLNVEAGDSFAVRSIALNDYLIVYGSLSVSGQLTQDAGGEIDIDDGTLNVGAITNNAYDIQGDGVLVVGALTNNTLIIGGNLEVDAGTLVNTGMLTASEGTTTIKVGAGGFSSLTDGTLSSGGLEALPDGVLVLDASGPITVDAATITLAGGVITSLDPATGQDVPLTSSLDSVAASGALTLDGGSSYQFGQLTVAGTLTLSGSSDFNADQLVIAAGGQLQGVGEVNSPIENDGVIRAGESNEGSLVLDGAVTGSGSLEVLAGYTATSKPFENYGPTLELGGPSDENVVFDGDQGTLRLDQPSGFTGAITTSGVDDTLLLVGVSLQSTTGMSYTDDSAGGVLTLQEASGALSFQFDGSHTLADFTLAAGPQVLSSDPPTLQVKVDTPLFGLGYTLSGDNESVTAPITGRAYFQADGANDTIVLNGNVQDYTLSRVQPSAVSGATAAQVGAFLLTATNGSGAYAIEEGVSTVQFQDGQYLALRDLPAYISGSAALQMGGSGNDLLFQNPSEAYELFIGGAGNDEVFLKGDVGDYTLKSFFAVTPFAAVGSGYQSYSGEELVANNGSGDLLIDSSVETVQFKDGQYLAYKDLPSYVAANTSAPSDTLNIGLDGDDDEPLGYDSLTNAQEPAPNRVLLNGNVSDYTLSRNAAGDFVLDEGRATNGVEDTLTISSTVQTVQFADGQYLAVKDLGAYIAGSDVFTQGTYGDDLLIAGDSGDQYVIGGGGTDDAYVAGDVTDYTIKSVDQLASGADPEVDGYELVADNGSVNLYIDQSTETIHFQNGQYLAFHDLPAYIAADVVDVAAAGTVQETTAGLNGLTVKGFAAGDVIDATDLQSGSANTSFKEDASNTFGTLTIADGSKLASVILFGQFMAAGFATAPDAGAGTAISYTPPTAQNAVAPPGH